MQTLDNNEARPKFTSSYKKKACTCLTFPFMGVLGYQLQVLGVWIGIALHYAGAP